MKTKFLLSLIVIFMTINSCNNSVIDDLVVADENVDKANIEKESLMEIILPSSFASCTYVNIINSSYCFSCFPVFGMVADQMLKSGYNPDNLVYIFPSMRKVMQADFLEKNFNLHPEDARVIFDDQVYDYFQEEYQLDGSSNMLCFNQNKELISKAEYDRANVSEILAIVN